MFGVRNDAEVDRIGEACGGKEGQAGDCKAVFGGRGLHLMRLRLTQLIGQAVVGHDEGTDIGKLLAAHPGRFWGIFSRMASASPSELLMASGEDSFPRSIHLQASKVCKCQDKRMN